MPIRIPTEQLIGQRYSRLLLLDEVEPDVYPNGEKKRNFLCLCDCGKKTVVRMSDMKSGRTQSCGCLNIEKIALVKYKHGLHGNELYCRWKNMKRRCYDKKAPNYINYGGRGISVCDEWKDNYAAFYNWAINNGYKKELQIDRRDNDKNYEPSNCRFVTQAVNNTNKRVRKDSRRVA